MVATPVGSTYPLWVVSRGGKAASTPTTRTTVKPFAFALYGRHAPSLDSHVGSKRSPPTGVPVGKSTG